MEETFAAKINYHASLTGGCISEAYLVELSSHKKIFTKFFKQPTDMFEVEAHGLNELARWNSIGVPEVYSHGPQHLFLEYLEPSSPRGNFAFEFGQQFAGLHQNSSGSVGWKRDNYIGSTRQLNKNEEQLSWSDFFWQKRLSYQINLAGKENFFQINELEQVVKDKLNQDRDPICVLHGDLWSGNYICSEGKAYLIDPATYYGSREADLAMTKLFGGFPAEFYQGYQQQYPWQKGWEEREKIYQLYHVLNHYNLFGGHYLSQANDLIKGIIS